ncbi:TonB-dependent receptor [Parabacteroides sp. PFB2-10]|uniref:TonB-dependent receptor n=1 Tax=Parabacteroides sp. PFB2-10 TaxID=1742405 RepID=UPI002472E982|nr:TonB-dependent receptor [Parabacteroides sp. PFB2-10]
MLILCAFQSIASPYDQNTRIDLDVKQSTLKQLFKEIESKTDYTFFYNDEVIDLDRVVDVYARKETVENILHRVLTNCTFSIENKNILLIPKNLEVAPAIPQQSTRSITGTITDELGDPVVGANVVEKGTTNGIVTDINGNFALTVAENATLQISYIGYITQEMLVSGRSTFAITLREDSQALDEVVVIGYGVQRKSDVTGSISSVKTNEIENRSVSDVAQALQGKAAGVQILNTSGAPGSQSSIQIRGYSSNSRTSPLIIVDGLKVTDLNYLDPENVESIEILKDGASAAIYGIEAGNGVILISTKSGKSASGKGRVFYNMQHTFQSIVNMPPVLNAKQYMDYQLRTGGVVNEEQFQYDGISDTNWGEQMFETGIMQRHTIGFEGGNDRGNLYVSISSMNNNGIVIGNKDIFKRLTGQINADYKIKDWLTVGVNTSLEKNQSRSVSEAGAGGFTLFGSIFYYDPITPWTYDPNNLPTRIQAFVDQGQALLRDENDLIYGSSIFGGNSMIYHPMVRRNMTDSDNRQFNIRGTAFVNLTPIKGLVITSRLGYRTGYRHNSTYNHNVFINSTANQPMSISGRTSYNLFYQWENFANYMFNIKAHNFTAMAGMAYQRSESNFTYANANTLSSDDPNFRYLNSAVNSSQMSVDGAPSFAANMSYYGRIGWSYRNRYNLQASFRADAYDTSKLDKDHRWGYFPSISGGWTISNESFMQNIKSTLNMSMLRLRVSYGINGNVDVLNNYQYNSTLSTNARTGYDFGYGTGQSGQVIAVYPSTRLPNPKVTWETSRQVDFGLDGRFLRDRLTFELDYFDKTTHNLLISTVAPAHTGASSVYINAGKVKNKGLEAQVGWKNSHGDFSYNVNGNIAFLKNEVIEDISKTPLAGSGVQYSGTVTYFEEGYPVWYLRTYEFAGINPENGRAIYTDFDKDGSITESDRKYAGNAIPKYTYGLTATFGYKNFDLVVYGSGVGGNKILYGATRGDFPQANTLTTFYENMWSPENKNAKYPILHANDIFYRTSDLMVFSGSFFKIKQIQLGYTVPSSISRKIGMSKLRAYVSLEDWFVFTKYPGIDPETNSMTATSAASALAIDYGNYPISKKATLGLNVSF